MNVVYTNLGGQAEHLDLYIPKGPAPAGGRPVILALPGGGWRWVRREDLGVTVSELAKYGYVVAVADYAFASSNPGSHVWPTNFEDVRQAVRWLKTNAGKYGIDPSEVGVWGESAGAHLGNLLGTDPDGPLLAPSGKMTGATAPGQVSAQVQAVIDFYGPTDLTSLFTESPKDDAFLDTFIGGPPSKYPAQYVDASPVTHVSSATPPFLIYQGTADTAVAPAQAAELDQTLTKAGIPHTIEYFPGISHGFRLNPIGNINLLPQILAFLDANLYHGAAPS
jgi:acetyl esterase/lipase